MRFFLSFTANCPFTYTHSHINPHTHSLTFLHTRSLTQRHACLLTFSLTHSPNLLPANATELRRTKRLLQEKKSLQLLKVNIGDQSRVSALYQKQIGRQSLERAYMAMWDIHDRSSPGNTHTRALDDNTVSAGQESDENSGPTQKQSTKILDKKTATKKTKSNQQQAQRDKNQTKNLQAYAGFHIIVGSPHPHEETQRSVG